MTTLSDEYLMDQIQQGQVDHLGLLYERYKPILFNYFLRSTQNYDVGNDLLMETFERVYKYRKSYKSSNKVRPWLFQIASNLVSDYFKQVNQQKTTKAELRNTLPKDQEMIVKDTDRNSLLMSALGQLKTKERNIITKYYLLELNYEEIAQTEGITVNTARIVVCRALKKLRELLQNTTL